MSSVEDENARRGEQNRIRGQQGEDLAAAKLKAEGWKVVGRNVRPCFLDRRCEIDIVATREGGDRVAFVEVKSHMRRTPFAPVLAGISKEKKKILLKAFSAWLRKAHWDGNYQFDVVEVYGEDLSKPEGVEVDHFENVPFFPYRYRFR